MSVLVATNTVILGQAGGLEPIRSSHYHILAIDNKKKPISRTTNYQLRKVDGISQATSSNTWEPNALGIEYPLSRPPTTVRLEYMLMVREKGSKTDPVIEFWSNWANNIHGISNDTPLLWLESIGEVSVTISEPGLSPKEWKTIKLIGVWPKELSLGALDQDSENPLSFTVNLSVAYIDWGNQ